MKAVLQQRFVSRDHVEILVYNQDGPQHVANVIHDGWQTWLEFGLPLPAGSTATVVFPDRELHIRYHRTDISGREAEWYSIEGSGERYESVLELVECQRRPS